MILPIVGYGDPVLRKVADTISSDYPNLKETVANMYDTMYNACGVGLAAPQVGLSIRLFVIDTAAFGEDDELESEEQLKLKNFKRTFINPKMIKEEGEITLEYCDEDFVVKTEVFDGLIARVIQHEYDHIEGILFTDLISSLKKQLIKKKLQNIMDGKARPDYRMKFCNKKGR